MANWDIFHTDRLRLETGLGAEAVREGIASGAIRPDDLARPAGTDEPWARVDARGALLSPESTGQPGGGEGEGAGDRSGPVVEEAGILDDEPALEAQFAPEDEEDDEPIDLDDDLEPTGQVPDLDEERTVELRRAPADPRPDDPEPDDWDELVAAAGGSMPPPASSWADAPPVAVEDAHAFPPLDEPEAFDPLDEDEEAAAFTLAAEPPSEPDEIDLTAMVDVAFQLVLFFLVTATTIYFKTLEIPTPEPDEQEAVAQQMRTLDELLEEYILVEIDPQGRVQVDREPIAPDELTARLRQVRSDTLRTGMLLMADFATPHRNAVLAIDSANAIGLEIAIAKPSAPTD
ncbi:ExbD/TolR family protein [Tautonia plasticadhaerens]|uniref:Biopolymer transport protein ExbD/TolR n=1 Tax=Tautonia plasticadhaerens TaxID=2527974 RepID=A0A518HDF7_9BACT|nr:biopolymer transporter ExbD [Tautonia plasticadhaerens]QDV38882.1 Biopolymer transport protein ExbD/TolR [Tautonia plasticadhaerens]